MKFFSSSRALAAFAIVISLIIPVGSQFSAQAKSKEILPPVDPSLFAEFDPNSRKEIEFQEFTDALITVVYRVGQSRSILRKGQTETYNGSRFAKATNISESRYEGNRLFLHNFDKDIEAYFLEYQSALEEFARGTPISSLNKDSQLAFWLNLHNVIVLNHLIDEYPIKSLKKFRKNKDKGLLYEKAVEINGQRISAADIENIVIQNWDSPLVIYGLWQGSIGGPTLPNQAFTASNVWALLKFNAAEFVNSNRGARPFGTKMVVSEFYEWTLDAFGGSEQELLKHIKALSDGRFHGDILNVSAVGFDYYDWGVTDLVGGSGYTGQHNQVGALVSGAAGSSGSNGRPQGKGPGGNRPPGTSYQGSNSNWSLYKFNDTVDAGQDLPPDAVQLIREMKINNYPPRTIALDGQ